MAKAVYKMKAFNWGLGYSFGGLVHDHHGREHGSRQAAARQTDIALEQ